jgi:hypothetical protein
MQVSAVQKACQRRRKRRTELLTRLALVKLAAAHCPADAALVVRALQKFMVQLAVVAILAEFVSGHLQHEPRCPN